MRTSKRVLRLLNSARVCDLVVGSEAETPSLWVEAPHDQVDDLQALVNG